MERCTVAQWTHLPKHLHAIVAATPGSVLLQTSRFDASNRYSYLFLNPAKTIAASTLDEIPTLFQQIEQALANGLYVAGYLSYECGYHFERFDGSKSLAAASPSLGSESTPSPSSTITQKPASQATEPPIPDNILPEENPTRFTDNATLTISEDEYCKRIEKIKEYIQAGDTYQVNFTDSVSMQTTASPASAFAMLSESQPVSYSAFINTAGHHILSLSPELFFRIESGRITTRPMKGTMPRGLDLAEDAQQAIKLQSDPKNRSEHVMIVDLLRNDLGRICTMGSVHADDLFSVERYETLPADDLHHLSAPCAPTSATTASSKPSSPAAPSPEPPKSTPCNSFANSNALPRGIYTGAIGFISPNNSAVFNVAIRTLVLKDGAAQMGVGGGIVADSTPAEEYRECLLKAGFLTRSRQPFQLIETMLCQARQATLPRHASRPSRILRNLLRYPVRPGHHPGPK